MVEHAKFITIWHTHNSNVAEWRQYLLEHRPHRTYPDRGHLARLKASNSRLKETGIAFRDSEVSRT